MLQRTPFEVNQHKGTEQTVIKHQIDTKMLLVKSETDLPPHKSEAFAQFQKESLQMVYQPLFKFTFSLLRQFG